MLSGPVDDGRRRRLAIIVGVVSLLVLAWVILSTIGSRQADDEVSRIRLAAGAASVTAADFAAAASGPADDPVAEALGVSSGDVSGSSDTGASWCVTIEIDRLLASRSLHFTLDASGRLTEVPGCTEPSR